MPDSKMKQFQVLFRTHTGGVIHAEWRGLTGFSIGQDQLKKITQKYMPSILNRLKSLSIIWNGGWSNSRDINYIFIENVYFPMNLKGMATINWGQNPQMFLHKCEMSR